MAHRTAEHTPLRAVYNTKTGRVIVYDEEHDQQGRVFLPEERMAVEYGDSWQDHLALKLRSRNPYVRFFLAELLGTFILVAFGVGCVAQTVLNSANFRFNFVIIALGWGFAVAFGVYVSGGASGGHINPAVTVCFALFGRLKWRFVPVYILGQYVGAFLASFCIYIVYYNQLDKYDNGTRQGPFTVNATRSTAGIWATYPQNESIETWQCFIDQIFGTGLLVLMALAVTDKRNMEPPKGMIPLVIGFVVAGLITAFESNCGAALNPARDFAPRFFTSIAGWEGVFGYRDYNWFWVPILGPHLGAILGGLVYNGCVGIHLPPALREN